MQRSLTLLTALIVLLLYSTPAYAIEFESFISIEDEDDLYEYLELQEVEPEIFETLLELLYNGIDLNKASYEDIYNLPNLTLADAHDIVIYRKQRQGIENIIDLVRDGVLSKQKLIAILPFLIKSSTQHNERIIRKAFIKLNGLGVNDIPYQTGSIVGSLTANVFDLDLQTNLTVIRTNNRLSDVDYDPHRNALIATAPQTQYHIPKTFIQAKYHRSNMHISAILGTYRAGFAQKLTFDNSGRYTPNGIYFDKTIRRIYDLTSTCKESQGELETSPCSAEEKTSYTTPDYAWSEGLLGGGTQITVEIDDIHLQGTGFVSYQDRSIYQYEVEDTDSKQSPTVFNRQDDDLTAPTSKFIYSTLPNLYQETLFGGNVSAIYHDARDRHASMGITAYRSSIHWNPETIKLDFRDFASRPAGPSFGAVGFDLHGGIGPWKLYTELTTTTQTQQINNTSDDTNTPYAAIIRGVHTTSQTESELIARYYDTDFVNPYSRPVAAADEYQGLRARDEQGIRLKHTNHMLPRLTIRSSIDLWKQISHDINNLDWFIYGEAKILDPLSLSLSGRFTDKDQSDSKLEESDNIKCYESSTKKDADGNTIPCSGERYQTTLRIRFSPSVTFLSSLLGSDPVILTAYYRHQWLHDGNSRYNTDTIQNQLRQDHSLGLSYSMRIKKILRFSGLLHYRDDSIAFIDYSERKILSRFKMHYNVSKNMSIEGRYQFSKRIDERDSTLERHPLNEHWISFVIKAML